MANWNYIGHVVVGTVITCCQAVALADPASNIVSYCHIISLVAMQLGVSLGVWQVSQVVQMRAALAAHQSPPPPLLGEKEERPAA
jgi:hypothetical protein